MILFFDIGGTKFRYYLLEDDFLIDSYTTLCNDKDIFLLLKNCTMFLNTFYKINEIYVSIAGIVDNYKITGMNNLKLKNNKLIDELFEIPVYYINDGDAFILGEMEFNNMKSDLNVLGLYFGTGVGCGLYLNKNLVKNSEAYRYMEKYMKENVLNENNINEVCKFLGNEISNLVELLNLDYIIINGYVNKFNDFPTKLINNLNFNKYYKTKLIFSKCDIPIAYGLFEFRKYILTNGLV